ncbi:MAG: High-affinity nickel transporter, partial [Planctomycetes bacterium]|nr:High-affinity nickel transporter [Planctomycetota bacterium]
MPTANALLVLAAGLGAGALHALAGPDHLAGVAPFAARAGRRAWRVGVAWGVGHAAGALLG